jgi:hypothetical protein
MKEHRTMGRRAFLKVAAGTLLAAALGGITPLDLKAQARSKVVLVRNKDVLGPDGKIDRKILGSMLDDAVKVLTAEADSLKAWNSLIKPSDVLGIKTNQWRHLPTPPELEEVVRSRALGSGVAETRIAIDDRGIRDNPVFINSTALINMRPLRTHHWAGVGTCLKNYIMFVPTPSGYHPDGCSELGKIWTLPGVKAKTRLNVLVALTPQFYGRGANFFDRRYVWPYKGLIVGIDPVAVDATGAELLRLKRIAFFGEDKALDVAPVHIQMAEEKYNLGVADLKRIEIIKIGLKEEILL